MEKIEVLGKVYYQIPETFAKSIIHCEGNHLSYTHVIVLWDRHNEYECMIMSDLIMHRIGQKKFEQILCLLDPLITEAVLLGDLIKGEKEEFETYRQMLFSATVSADTINYLMEMARINIYGVGESLKFNCDSAFIRYGIYKAVLFSAFAKQYLLWPKITSVTRLLMESRYPLLNQAQSMMDHRHEWGRDECIPAYEQAKDFVEEVAIKIATYPVKPPKMAILH